MTPTDDPFTPTLIEILRRRAGEQPDKTAYRFLANGEEEVASLTYAELDRRARALGALLQSQGPAGERALLLYPPGLEFVVSFLGCLYGGAIAVPAYPPRANRGDSRLPASAEDAGPPPAPASPRRLPGVPLRRRDRGAGLPAPRQPRGLAADRHRRGRPAAVRPHHPGARRARPRPLRPRPRARGDPVGRDRGAGPRLGGALDPAGRLRRNGGAHRLPAVHLRLHRDSQGGDG